MANSNLNQAARRYEKEFKGLLQAVYKKESYFGDFFGGGIEALDGVENNENAFYLKTSDIPVVIGKYNTDADVAFNEGTANTSRFGERTEIVYTNTAVPYTNNWKIHEGIDRYTVNNDFESAIADRLELQAKAKVQMFNKNNSKFISDSAGKTMELATQNADGIADIFNELAVYFANLEVVGTLSAKVTPEIYNIIVDHNSTTTAKHSSANIDNNTILSFKGFNIQRIPDKQFQEGETIYAFVEGMARAFTGINTVRSFDSEDFDGVALQGAGKGGEFILDDNKPAIVKVTSTP